MKKNLKARMISFFMSFAMLFQILSITVFAAMNPPTIVSVGGINVDQETNMGGAPTVIKGQAYSAQVDATGAELTYTAGVGSYMTLPAGLTINSETGLISGNCTAENGRYDVYIEVSNATGKAHAIVGFTVGDSSLAPVITTEAGSFGTTYKDAYNYFMVSIDNENGVASDIYGFNWSLASGSLPDGMSLLYTNKPTVHISGTPTETGTFTFELKAENDFGYETKSFSIEVIEGEVRPEIIEPENQQIGNAIIGQAFEYQFEATGTNTLENPIFWSIDDDDFTQESYELGKGLSVSKTGFISGIPTEAGTVSFTIYAKNNKGKDSVYAFINIHENGEATSISITPEIVVLEKDSEQEFTVSLEGYGDIEQEAYWDFYYYDSELGSAFPMPTDSELNVDRNTPSDSVTLTVGENEETQQFRVVAYSKSGYNGVRAYATVMVDADYKFITQPQSKELAVGEPFYPEWELNFEPTEVIIEYNNEGVWSIWNTANATGGTILAQDNPLTLRVKASKNGLSIYSNEFQASWEDNYEFSVTPNTIEWGNVDWTGSYSEKTATIENIGTKTFDVECSTNDEFNISIDNVNNALMPGGQTILHITPKQDITAGNHNFNLTLKSTDVDDKWSMNLPVSINVVAPTFTTAPQGGTVTVDSTHTVNFALDKEPESIELQWYNDYSDAWAYVATLENDATSATVPAEDSAQTKQYRILATYGLNTISSEFEVTWEEAQTTTYLITLIGHDITNTSTAGGKLYLETDEGSVSNNGTLYVSGYATENVTDNVTINAVADDGYEFVEWRLASPTGSQLTTNANHTFTATQQLYLYAIFQEESVQPTTYTVTVIKGTASPTSAAEGATVTITADTPEQGKEFDKWVVNAGGVTLADATASETTFMMGTANVEVEATYKDIVPIGNIVIPEFAKQEEGYSDLEYKGVSVTITNNARIDPAKTSVVLGGLRPGDFEYILNQNHGFMTGPGTWDTLLSVRPKTGLGAGLSIATITLKYDCDGDGEYETTIGSGEISFGVSAKTYTVTVTKGTASVEKAKEGIEVTITADTPEQGKEFDKWVVNAGGVTLADATASETTFTMGTANVEVEATYKNIQYWIAAYTTTGDTTQGTVQINSGSKGSSRGQNFAYNTNVTLTAEAAEGFRFVRWDIKYSPSAGVSATNSNNPTTVNALQDYYYYAVFEADTSTKYTTTVNSGTATPTQAAEGVTVTITAAEPESGKEFDKWTVVSGGITLADETASETTFTMGTSNVVVTATYKNSLPTYTVTFNSNGGSTVASIENVSEGSTIAKPTDPTRTGYTFAGWYKDAELTKKFNFATDTITGDTTLFAKWNKKQTTGGGGGGGSATTKYTITVKQNDNGKISPETTKVEKGDNQKFEIKADKGYEVEKVLVDGKSVGAVTEYTFEKVKEKHTIEATFKKVEEVTEETWKNPFTDVTEDDWFYEAVKYANENKLFNGVSSTEFGPNVSMTRAMLVTVLYRLEGEPATNRSIPFADVDMSMYYANAVIWAKQNNIVNGVDETNFAPNLEVTREQLVTILYRYAGYKGKDVSVGENTNILSYDDFSELSEYAIPAMQWACGSGIITGRTTSTIAPKGTATRAEVATMLMRFTK